MKQTSLSRLATRGIIARAVAARHGIDPFHYAADRWRGDAPVTAKAAVGGGTALDWSVSSSPVNLFDSVLEMTVVGQARLREVPFEVRLLRPSESARGYWIAPGKAIKLSRSTVLGSALPRKKVGAIVVTTGESLETADRRVERTLEFDFRRALSLAVDEAFLDPANTGDDATPAAVTAGVTPIPSTGDPSADLAALVAGFEGDLSQAVIVTDPTTATAMALWRDTSGGVLLPDCGAGGGSVLGLPLLVSRGSPRDSSGGSIVLLDGSGIAFAHEDFDIAATREALLELDDAPTGDALTPTAGTSNLVSMFQSETVAFKAVMDMNWEVQRPAVAVVTGASY